MDPLFDILDDLFSVDELEILLWRMGLELEHITALGPRPNIVKNVITYVDRRGLRPALVAAVRDARPRDARVVALADHVLETPYETPRGELQQLLTATSYVDPSWWFATASETATKICAIDAGDDEGTSLGTGFLVGPDLVLTAHHVVRDISDPESIRCWFDYARTKDGKTVFRGVPYGLASDGWLVAARPASPLDDADEASDELPEADQLDFALLRLARPAGEHSVGVSKNQPELPLRGWLDWNKATMTYEKNAPLLIYHHPRGRALKLSMGMESVIGLNKNQTRLRHRTNTQRGSSGAPCFDLDWRLIALHHAAQWSLTAPFNQAIPIGRIADVLRQENVLVGRA